MKFPVLPIILFFTFAVVFCLLVIFFTFDQPRAILAENDRSGQGKVLGVSEKADFFEYKNFDFKNNLPENPEISPATPVKSEAFTEPALPECSSIVIDTASGKILAEKDKYDQRPIASITKLAAILVLLDTGPDWDKIIEISPDDIVLGGHIYINQREKLSLKDLLYLSLVGSDNTAVMALARSTGFSKSEYVVKMNNKMQALGLAKTHFVDPVGISAENISTAFEVAKLAQIAFDEPVIQEATLVRNLKIKTAAGRLVSLRSTDDLLSVFPQNGIKLEGGKTGFTDAAGYCFVGKFTDEGGHELISVILGADNIKGRFNETKKIVDWAYTNYAW